MFLIVEDNKILAKNIKKILELNEFEWEITESAEQAEKLLKNKKYNLILLDINLPWKSGFEFLKQFRDEWNNTPVLILTSKNTIDDKVNGLELGADDYITKPFDMAEFIARIKAILRRENGIKSEIIKLDKYEIYPEEEKIIKDGAQIWLSSLEFKLLMYLIKNKWKIIHRDKIYEEVWGDFDNHMFSRSVDVYVANLRKKLGKDIIKTKKWSGYYI